MKEHRRRRRHRHRHRRTYLDSQYLAGEFICAISGPRACVFARIEFIPTCTCAHGRALARSHAMPSNVDDIIWYCGKKPYVHQQLDNHLSVPSLNKYTCVCVWNHIYRANIVRGKIKLNLSQVISLFFCAANLSVSVCIYFVRASVLAARKSGQFISIYLKI